MQIQIGRCHAIAMFVILFFFAVSVAEARNPIRRDFFDLYPQTTGTQLDDLPSSAGHCGVCHFDFDGGGTRNPYGAGVEVGINNGLSSTEAILAIENDDSDLDGFVNLTEITDLANFDNTPTFPGLSGSNYTNASNIPLSEIEPYLVPSGGSDTTPPDVLVLDPNGGEALTAGNFYTVLYDATDASGVASAEFYLSDDSGNEFKKIGRTTTPDGDFAWFVPNRPGVANRIRVEARDVVGNEGEDLSDADFEIIGEPAGYVPSTLRDMDLSGTQPHEGAVLENPNLSCATCHGNYDTAVEPWHNWRGSMMGQAARDPLFLACLAIAEQDAPSVGDVCIRCHSPGGWQEGRSDDTSGGLLTAKDRHGVQCDFCHRAVDHNYVAGVSPLQDLEVLDDIDPLPLQYGNGQFVNDPAPLRRGPYADALAAHDFVESPFHRSADICGICHDVSNPVFNQVVLGDYAPNAFDEQHPDMDLRNMFPIERTYSEWSESEYATTGVYAPQFAGDKPDGIVSTCQDCHMRDVTGQGCDDPAAPVRGDLGLHDLMGGNTFIPAILPTFFPDEVDVAQLDAAAARAESMLVRAATLEVTPEEFGVTVRVTNETGHKLPSGYPEGRRIWLNLQAFDEAEQLVFESGAYNFDTGELVIDDQAKVYEIHPGLSEALADGLGLPPGKSFHFVLNDTIYSDNRIPPRGFTNAGFAAVQSPVVDYSYADGQHWDETAYTLPGSAVSAVVTLYYQATSKEYIEFLRDENETNSAGQDLYDAWAAQGRGAPVTMAQVTTPVEITPSDAADEMPPALVDHLAPIGLGRLGVPARIHYTLGSQGHVELAVYDIHGRRVRTIVSGKQAPGRYDQDWDARDAQGRALASGVYFVRLKTQDHDLWRKALLMQ